ncbi:hypothetical protein D3C81_76580 [compost metagenome]|uniref:hypothetical protein n=1 Tax=Serratia plymuthica TaxID=82996 RepID=UPI0002A3F7B5|nr:hypothetical protein [Serratia plymuthica]ANJ94052.1 hypothetical protein ADP72_14115 [Serratia plymuthica]EKF62434.1 putative membrane protein [Serratia plymuthica A30]MBI6138087.1 hypothetical protein [Serratia plymuthica]NIC27061.1 hypothetical protein [Serratia plymuthica]
MKEFKEFGRQGDYEINLKKKILPFCTSRIAPYLGFLIISIVIARFNRPELATFSYLTALYALPVVILSMPLAMIGNIVVSARKHGGTGENAFLSGIPLCILLSMLGLITAALLDAFIVQSDGDIKLASHIYVYCVPVLIINTYLFFFIESFVSGKTMAKIKTFVSIISSLMITYLAVTSNTIKTKDIFEIFLIIEMVFFSIYSIVIMKKVNFHQGRMTWGIIRSLMVLGIPVAIGLAGQKLVYFLLTERLLDLNKNYVADLSVLMSMLGLLSIPVTAFAQIHSLFVSESSTNSQYIYFKKGIVYLSVIILATLVISNVAYNNILGVFGSNLSLSNVATRLSLSVFFIAVSSMLLCMSHLRAINDTLVPQSIANVVLIVIFVPLIFTPFFSGLGVAWFLFAQSSCIFMIVVFLVTRIMMKNSNLILEAKI